MDILHENLKLVFGNLMVVIDLVHKFEHFWVTYVEVFVHRLKHMTGSQLLWVNRDRCNLWDKKCSLFLEHLISLPLGIHNFTHTLHNLSVVRLCLRINSSGLFACCLFTWISLTALSWTYLISLRAECDLLAIHNIL